MTEEIQAALRAMRGGEADAGLRKRTAETLSRVEVAFVAVLKEFSGVEESAVTVTAAGQKTASLAANIAHLAQCNQESAQRSDEIGRELELQVATLRGDIAQHDRAAGATAEEAKAADQIVQSIAAIGRQTSVAMQEVEAAIEHQSEALNRLAMAVSQVTDRAEQVGVSLGRFRTEAQEPEEENNGFLPERRAA